MTDPVKVQALVQFNVDTKSIERDVQKALKNVFGILKNGGIEVRLGDMKAFSDSIHAFRLAINELKKELKEARSSAKKLGTGGADTASSKQRKSDLTAEIQAKEKLIKAEAQAQIAILKAKSAAASLESKERVEGIKAQLKASLELNKSKVAIEAAQAKGIAAQVALIKAQNQTATATNNAQVNLLNAQAKVNTSQANLIKAQASVQTKAAQSQAMLIAAQTKATVAQANAAAVQTQAQAKANSSQATLINAQATAAQAQAQAQATITKANASAAATAQYANANLLKNQAAAANSQAQAQAALIKANSQAQLQAVQAQAALIKAQAIASKVSGGGAGGSGGGAGGSGGGQQAKMSIEEAKKLAKAIITPMTVAQKKLNQVRNTFLETAEISNNSFQSVRVSLAQTGVLIDTVKGSALEYRTVMASFGGLFRLMAEQAEASGAAFGQQLVGGISLLEKHVNKEFKSTIDQVTKFSVRSIQEISNTMDDYGAKIAGVRDGLIPPAPGMTKDDTIASLEGIQSLLAARKRALEVELVLLNRTAEVMSRKAKIAETRQRIEQKTNIALAAGSELVNKDLSKKLPDVIAKGDANEIRAITQEFEGAARQITNGLNSLQRLKAETQAVYREANLFREEMVNEILKAPQQIADAEKKLIDATGKSGPNQAEEVADAQKNLSKVQAEIEARKSLLVGLEDEIAALKIQDGRIEQSIKRMQEEKVAMNGVLGATRSLRREREELARISEQAYRRQIQLARQTSVLGKEPIFADKTAIAKLDPFSKEDVSNVKKRIREVEKQVVDLGKNSVKIEVTLDDTLASVATDFNNLEGQFKQFKPEVGQVIDPAVLAEATDLYDRQVKALRDKASAAIDANRADADSLNSIKKNVQTELDGFLNKAKAADRLNKSLDRANDLRLKAAKNEDRLAQAKDFMGRQNDPSAQLLGVQQLKKVGTEAASLADQLLQLEYELKANIRASGSFSKEMVTEIETIQKLRAELLSKSAAVSRNAEELARQEKQAKRSGQGFRLYSARLAESIKSQLEFSHGLGITMSMMMGARTAFTELLTESRAFARTMVVIQSKTQTFAKSYEMLKEVVRDTSVEFGRSVEEVAEIAKQFGSAGFSLEQTMAALRSTTQLVIATNADAEASTRAIAGIYRVFSGELKQTGSEMNAFKRINDVLLGVYREHQVELDELVQGFRFSASAAKISGFTFSENAAFLSVLNDNMIKSGTAGRGLQVVLAQVAAKSEAVSKAYGVNIDRSLPLTEQFIDVLRQVNIQLQSGERSVEDLDVGFKLFGLRGLRTFKVLAEKFPDLIKFMRQLDKESKGLGDELSQIVKNELATQFDAAKMGLIDLARSFVEPSKALIILVTDLVKKFRDLYKSLGPIADIFSTFVIWSAGAIFFATTVRSLGLLFGTLTVEAGKFGSQMVANSGIIKLFNSQMGVAKVNAMMAASSVQSIGGAAGSSAQKIGMMSTSVAEMGKKIGSAAVGGLVGFAALSLVLMASTTSVRELSSELDVMSASFSQTERSLRELDEFEEKIDKIGIAVGRVSESSRSAALQETLRETNKNIITGTALLDQNASANERMVDSNIANLKREAAVKRDLLLLEEKATAESMKMKSLEIQSMQFGKFDFSEFALWDLEFSAAASQLTSLFKNWDGQVMAQTTYALEKRLDNLDNAGERLETLNREIFRLNSMSQGVDSDNAVGADIASKIAELKKEAGAISDASREFEMRTLDLITQARSLGNKTNEEILSYSRAFLKSMNTSEKLMKRMLDGVSARLVVPISFTIPARSKAEIKSTTYGFLHDIVKTLDAPFDVSLFDSLMEEMDSVVDEMLYFDKQMQDVRKALFISAYENSSEFDTVNEGFLKELLGEKAWDDVKSRAKNEGRKLNAILNETFANMSIGFDASIYEEVIEFDSGALQAALEEVFQNLGDIKAPKIQEAIAKLFPTAGPIDNIQQLSHAFRSFIEQTAEVGPGGGPQATIGSVVQAVQNLQIAFKDVGVAAGQSQEMMAASILSIFRSAEYTTKVIGELRASYKGFLKGMFAAAQSKALLNPLEQMLKKAEGLRQMLKVRGKNDIGRTDEVGIESILDARQGELEDHLMKLQEAQDAADKLAMTMASQVSDSDPQQDTQKSQELLAAMVETLNLQVELVKLEKEIFILRAKETYELRQANAVLYDNVRLQGSIERGVRTVTKALKDEIVNRVRIATLEELANRSAGVQIFYLKEFVELLTKVVETYHQINDSLADEISSRFDTLKLIDQTLDKQNQMAGMQADIFSKVVSINNLNRKLISQQEMMAKLQDNSYEAQSKVASIIKELIEQYASILEYQDKMKNKEQELNDLASNRHDIYKQIAGLLSTEMEAALASVDQSISRQYENASVGIDAARRLARATGVSVNDILFNKDKSMSDFFGKMKKTWTPSVGVLGKEFQNLSYYITETSLRQESYAKKARELALAQAGLEIKSFGKELAKGTKEGVDKAEQALSKYQSLIESAFTDPEQQIEALEFYLKLREELLNAKIKEDDYKLLINGIPIQDLFQMSIDRAKLLREIMSELVSEMGSESISSILRGGVDPRVGANKSTVDAAVKAYDDLLVGIKSLAEVFQKVTKDSVDLKSSNDSLKSSIDKLTMAMEAKIGLRTGGPVPGGYGGGDIVPAMLEPGEFVIPKHIVSKMGLGFFENLRAGGTPGYQDGGQVSASGASSYISTVMKQFQYLSDWADIEAPTEGHSSSKVYRGIPDLSKTVAAMVDAVDASPDGRVGTGFLKELRQSAAVAPLILSDSSLGQSPSDQIHLKVLSDKLSYLTDWAESTPGAYVPDGSDMTEVVRAVKSNSSTKPNSPIEAVIGQFQYLSDWADIEAPGEGHSASKVYRGIADLNKTVAAMVDAVDASPDGRVGTGFLKELRQVTAVAPNILGNSNLGKSQSDQIHLKVLSDKLSYLKDWAESTPGAYVSDGSDMTEMVRSVQSSSPIEIARSISLGMAGLKGWADIESPGGQPNIPAWDNADRYLYSSLSGVSSKLMTMVDSIESTPSGQAGKTSIAQDIQSISPFLQTLLSNVESSGGQVSSKDSAELGSILAQIRYLLDFTNIVPEESVKKFARGGSLPGYGGGDTVPAMLEPGEFVIPKHIVKKMGVGFFEKLRTGMIPGFTGGGSVGGAPSGSRASIEFNSEGFMSRFAAQMGALTVAVDQVAISAEKVAESMKVSQSKKAAAQVKEVPAQVIDSKKFWENTKAKSIGFELPKLTVSIEALTDEVIANSKAMVDGTIIGGSDQVGAGSSAEGLASKLAKQIASTAVGVTGSVNEDTLKNISKVDKSRRKSTENEADALSRVLDLSARLKQQADKLKQKYSGLSVVISGAIDSFIGALPAALSSLNSVLIPEFAVQNAEVRKTFIETMKEIEKTFKSTFESAVTQLQRNEISYYSYLNAIQDAERTRNEERLAAEDEYRKNLKKTGDIFKEMTSGMTANIFSALSSFGDSMFKAQFDKVSEQITGAIAKPFMDLSESINDMMDFGFVEEGVAKASSIAAGLASGGVLGLGAASNGVAGATAGGGNKDVVEAIQKTEESNTRLFMGMSTDIALGVGGAVLSGMATLTSSLVSMTLGENSGDDTVMFIEKFFRELPEMAPKFIDKLIENTDRIIESISEGIPILIDILLEEAPRFLEALVASLETAVPLIVNSLAEALPGLIAMIVPMLMRVVTLVIKQVPKIIEGLAASIPVLIIEVIKGLPGIAIALVEAIFKGLYAAIKGFFDGMFGGIFGKIGGLLSSFAGIFHQGGVVNSTSQEALILARKGEGILTPEAVSRLGGESAIRAINAGFDPASSKPMTADVGFKRQSLTERPVSSTSQNSTYNNVTLSTELTGRETDSELRERSEKLLNFIDEGLAKRTRDRRSKLAKVV